MFTPFAFVKSAAAASQNIVTSNLIFHLDISNNACYPGSGTEVYNLVGNNTGSFVNTVNYSSTDGGYLYAEGAGYVNFPDASTSVLDTTFTNFTSQVWWKPTGTATGGGDNGGIYGKMGGPGDRGFCQYQWQSQYGINYIFFNSDNGTEEQLLGTSLTGTDWWFLTFVFSANTYQRTYRNTTIDVDQTSGVANVVNGANSRPFRLFDRGDNDYKSYGQIGALYIYNSSLSEAEITQNYNATKTRYGL